MSEQEFQQLVNDVTAMSVDEKRALREVLDKQLAEGANGTHRPEVLKAGWAKGLITIGPDFDEPLEDFKEYME